MSRAEELNRELEVLARERGTEPLEATSPLESFEMVFEAAKADDFLFDLGDGFFATYVGIFISQPANIKEFQFDPVKNEAYEKERRRLKDDFDIFIKGSERLMELADQYLDFKEGKAN